MNIRTATLENSGENWTHWAQRWMGFREFNVRKPSGYRVYGWDEVVKHDKVSDCWIVVHGKVYDVTDWAARHPGGKVIYEGAGGDCTAAWERCHPLAVVQRGIPRQFLIGEIRDYAEEYDWDSAFYRAVKARVDEAVPRTKRRYDRHMTLKGLALLVLYFSSLACYIYFARWWTAVLYGLLCSQVGINIIHEGSESAFTSSKTLGWMAGRSLDFVGRRHLPPIRHCELSTYTRVPFVRLHNSQPQEWFHTYQHYYAWLVYLATNFCDLFETVEELSWLSRFPSCRGATHASTIVFQLLVKFCWIFYAVLLPSHLHGFENVFGVWLLYMFSFGFGCAVFFAVNLGRCRSTGNSSDWTVLQATQTANFAVHSAVWTWITGGLNFQLEHRLFPALVHTRLPDISPIVQEVCKEHDVPYSHHSSLWVALKGHWDLLRALGNSK